MSHLGQDQCTGSKQLWTMLKITLHTHLTLLLQKVEGALSPGLPKNINILQVDRLMQAQTHLQQAACACAQRT